MSAHQRTASLGKWIKASKSASSGQCVEFSRLDADTIGVRDSKNPGGGLLRFTLGEFAAMLDGAKRGEFDGLLG